MKYDFEELNVYQDAIALAEEIYKLTKDFPKEEQYGLVSQIRRAAMSVALNIAEGKGRYYTKVYVQFLYQARGSLYETIALIKMSLRLGHLSEENMLKLMEKVDVTAGRLNNLIRALK
jgi:four helix bundle protein